MHAKSFIIGLEDYSISDIVSCVQEHLNHLNDHFILESLDFSIKTITPFGSRTKKESRDDSDLDIRIEYTGSAREDDLFNALNSTDNALHIEDIVVDFFPCRVSEINILEQRRCQALTFIC